jgi:dipeptidyl aminopeptidase/acylaminoacyl peptidase
VQLDAGKAQRIDNQLFSQPYTLDQVQWQADSQSFTFRYTERGHQLVRVIEVDAKTAQPKALLTERSQSFIDQWGAFYQTLSGPEKGFVWLSERDGWAHLYRYDNKGQLINQITQGNWRVRDVMHLDEKTQQLWFAASGMEPEQDPYFIHYYRINFDGTGLTALTTANATHQVSFSADRQYYIDLYSRVDLPNVAELRRSSDGQLIRTLAKADISRLTQAGFKAPEVFVAKGRDGKTDIWGLIVKPQQFKPEQKYPVIENIYAGPHDSFVPKSFWPFGFHSGGDKVIGMQALADLGFVVVQIDGMGTKNRSKAFHDVAWKNLADSGFPDRILWHKAAAKQFPWYNMAAGVGIYGASAGGQSTVAALLFHPEVYTTGVAYAGCYDNRMDKISWNEQWMGYPVGPHYAASSVTEHAELLQGNLLLINGEQDSNVDPASTMQLVNALIKADKDFDLLLVPGGEHAVGRSVGPIRYVQRRQFDFFQRHLKQQSSDRNKSQL